LPHIFEKFTQTDSSSYTKKSIRGSWLGLYLCHLLIWLIGWTITAQSTQNVWSTFTFSLPLHAPHIQ
jgi:signal transduction histidine kinase